MTRAWSLRAIALICAGCGGSHPGIPAFESGDAAPEDGGADSGDPFSSDDSAPAGDGEGPLLGLEGSTGSPTCTAGQYVGTYTGVNATYNLPISGPLALMLVQAPVNGEDFLAVNDGAFNLAWGTTSADAASGLIVISAMLTGNLNCQNGDFSAADPSAPWTTIGVPSGTAMVTFTGTYDAGAATIAGKFSVVDSLSSSNGTWTVTLAP
jgi:hypothetical protein